MIAGYDENQYFKNKFIDYSVERIKMKNEI